MNMKLYVIYDSVAGVYGPVFEQTNDAAAKRMFQALMAKPDNVNYASDMTLYSLGDKDTVISRYMEKVSDNDVGYDTEQIPVLDGVK